MDINNDIKTYTGEETIEILINSNKSICRFGDGELKIISDENYNIGFQKNNKDLRSRLKSILLDKPNDNILVSVVFLSQPNNLINEERRSFIKEIIKKNNSDYIFGAANITRSLKYIPYFKKIWNEKDIVIIEGEHTRSGIGNDLFENSNSIKRIICPSTNAFNKYNEIYDYTINNISKDKIILCSLGPTATVLSYDLSKLGYRAIDLGHLDIIYEWRKIGPDKYVVKGKYVNEVKGGNNLDEIGDCEDINYHLQILKKIL